MKKVLFSLAMLCIGSTAMAATNVVKVVGYGEAGDDSFEVKTTKGYIQIYAANGFFDEESANVLDKAIKTKSCVKVIQNEMKTKIVKVDCPQKLLPIKE